MKIELHIPTEQYGFVFLQTEDISPEKVVELYWRYSKAFLKPVNVMPEAEFRKLYDKIGNGESVEGDPGVLSEMSPDQQRSINDLKKFIARCSYKSKQK